MEASALGPQNCLGSLGGFEKSQEHIQADNRARTSSAPTADAMELQEKDSDLSLSEAEAAASWYRKASPTPEEFHSACGSDEVQDVNRHCISGASCAVSCPNTSSRRHRTAPHRSRSGSPSADAARAQSVPAIHTSCTTSQLATRSVSPDDNSTHAFPVPCARRSSSAVSSCRPEPAAVPRTAVTEIDLSAAQQPQLESRCQNACDPWKARPADIRRCISNPELRRRRPLEQRTESAPLLLQLTSPSSSTARLQLEAIRAERCPIGKLSIYRANFIPSSGSFASAAGPFPPATQGAPDSLPQFPAGSSLSQQYACKPCEDACSPPRETQLPRASSAPAAHRRCMGGPQGVLGRRFSSCFSATLIERPKEPDEYAELSEINQGPSRSWSGCFPLQGNTHSFSLGPRSCSETGQALSLPHLSARPSVIKLLSHEVQAEGRSMRGPPHHVGNRSKLKEAPLHTRFLRSRLSAEKSSATQQLARPLAANQGEAFAVGLSESLQPRRISPGGMEVEGFVKGVQSCISRLIRSFPTGLELHNGYGSLSVPSYWIDECPTSHSISEACQRCMIGSANQAGCESAKRSGSAEAPGLPSIAVEAPSDADSKMGCERSGTPRSRGSSTAADCGHTSAVGFEVVYNLDVSDAEVAAGAASCYYAVEGMVGRGAHGAVFRAKRLVKISNSGSPTAASSPKAGEAAANDVASSEEPSGKGDEVELEEDEVALKIIDLDGALRTQCSDACSRARYIERVMTEANVLAQLQHEHIVKFYEAFQWPPCYLVLVTEYLPGGSLRDLYKSSGPLPEAIIAFVLKYVVAAADVDGFMPVTL